MYDVRVTYLNQKHRYFADMAWLQTTQPFHAAMSRLRGYSKSGAWVTLAMRDREVVGMNITAPAIVFPPAVVFCDKAGLEIDKVVMETMTYVHVDHRGNDLGRQMRGAAYVHSAAKGKTDMLQYGYETPEVLGWLKHLHATGISDTLDQENNPLIWVKLEKEMRAEQ